MVRLQHIKMLLLVCLLGMMAAMPAKAADESLRSLKPLATMAGSATPFDFAKLKGKPVVVTFFASWCPPCTTEFNEITQALADAASMPFEVVGVNAFEAWGGKKNPERMAAFLERTKPGFALVESTPKVLSAFGNIDRIPSLVVFDAQHREVWRFVHKRGAKKTHATAAEIRAAIAPAN